MAKKQSDKLDKAIEQEWYKQANGVQVNIMAIPEIFADVKQAFELGQTIAQAVENAIAKYRLN